MKLLKIFGLIIFVLVVGIRCSEDFVNTTNRNALTPELLFVSADNLEYLVRAMYASVKQRDLWGGKYFSHMVGCLSKELDLQWNADANWNDLVTHEIKEGNPNVAGIWNSLYRVVGSANSVLYYANKIEAATTNTQELAKLKLLKGEAYFVRAYAYFELIRLFGEANQPTTANSGKPGIPLVLTLATTMAEAQLPRSTVGEVYGQIIADLKEASKALPESRAASEVARAHKWAAEGLLGKVYVTMQDWANASTTLSTVINTGKSQSGHSLALVPFEQYKYMFNEQYEFNSESLFELNLINDPALINQHNSSPGTFHIMYVAPCYVHPTTGASTATGWSNVFVHQKSIDRIRHDPRGRISAYKPLEDSIYVGGVKHPVAKYFGVSEPDIEGWSFRKYTPIGKTSNEIGNNGGTNIHILRLADVFLLYAETLFAQNNEAQAREYTNKVRRRAHGKANYNESDAAIDLPATLTGATLLDAIREERFIELFAEGHAWYDVCRWGTGKKAADYYVRTRGGNIVFDEPHDYWLPIPVTELERNPNLRQSTGY